MEWLNYHHLLYFWTVARTGGVSAASAELRLAQPTISGQLRMLEEHFGEKLFHRVGRRLELTDVGRLVYRYADEIFTLGRELPDAVRGRPTGRPLRFAVGIADQVPKLIAYRLMEPALKLPDKVRLVCHEDKPERLFAELAVHALDLVLDRCAAEPDREGARLQPSPRRMRHDDLRRQGVGGALPARLPALARRRAVPAADRQHRAAPLARPVVRAARRAPRRGQRVRRHAPCCRPSASAASACSPRRPPSRRR